MKSTTAQNGAPEADVTERLKEMLRTLGPNARLPAERELARLMGASRPAVREAIRALAEIGVLVTRPGSGTTIADSGREVLKTPFEFLLLLEKPSVLELYEARELIEVFLAECAAERRAPDDLSALGGAFERMRANRFNAHDFGVADAEFHRSIAAAAHNPVLEHLVACLHDGIMACIAATTYEPFDALVSLDFHQAILDAITRRSVLDARRAMTAHMTLARQEYQRTQA